MDFTGEEEKLITDTSFKIMSKEEKRVLENIARKYENVREGVESVMGGRVLEYEAKTILREGLQEGRMGQAKETAWNLRSLGLEDETIARMVNVGVDQVKEWFAQGMGLP